MQNIIKNKKLLIVISAVFVIALFSVVLYQDSFAEVNVTVDGETQSIKTTNETVGEVIKESDIYIGDADYINFDENQKLEKGMDIVIKRSRPVTIEIGTRTITKKTYKDNIKDILKDFDITLGKDDKVSPGLNAKYTDAAIKLTQVEKKEIVEEKELEFTTLYKDNKGLELGKTNTVEKGIKGLKEIKKSQTFENGKLVKEDVISEEIVKEPVNQIVEKGKKPLTVASRGTKIE
ncbi:MAG: ubiquitin-like domain-containing protein, partial [Senegalia sp. (in: firmicutes)]|uniref:ubiquitin-like domain-containing protein n=2 Tax=Senegalia sp. (in: firmicutes) TaxID=1924098 RepID=UPI003F991688